MEVLRRDDLRGCWEVMGKVYGSREEAYDAAERVLDALQENPPEPDDSSPDLAERVSTGAADAHRSDPWKHTGGE